MISLIHTEPGLTIEGCRARQAALRNALQAAGLRAALLADRRHVHYFSGFWSREIFQPLMWIEAEGESVLIAPVELDRPVAAEVVRVYESNRCATLVEDQFAAAVSQLKDRLACTGPIGSDQPLRSSASSDLMPILRQLRRTKHADEAAMLTFCLRASEAAYQKARQIIAPGLCETELWAQMQCAAAMFAGETLGEFGNDFQVGTLGGAPRRRPMQAGEIAILDLGVSIRGYCGDMCRSLLVGARPNERQAAAHQRIVQVLHWVESQAKSDADCAAIFQEARRRLHAYNGWDFTHHLGHGIGLNPHEAPHLNAQWNDRLQIGDVFAVEPGLYGDGLRAGLRIEQVYHLTEAGLRRLTEFPIDL